jgi:AraC family transcriptional regulator
MRIRRDRNRYEKIISMATTADEPRTGFVPEHSRILSHQDDGVFPMFASTVASPAPSPTLRVELIELVKAEFRPHLLEQQLLQFSLSRGTVKYALNKGCTQMIPLTPGQAFFCPREEWHSVGWDSTMRFLSVQLNDYSIGDALGDFTKQVRLEFAHQVSDLRLTHLLWALESECNAGYPSGPLYLDGLETALASLLVQLFGPREKLKNHQGGLTKFQFKKVVELMEHNIDKPVSLKELCACIDLSSSYFSGAFRQRTGVAPYQYMLRLRIERARITLKTSNQQISDVARAVGFSNQRHFSKVFQRIVGVSPRDYRRER